MNNEQHTKWFETWFDSPYYHLLYKHRNCDEAEVFIDNLVKALQPKPKCRFLDLACGKGRHSLFLNKKGFDVTGIDLSPESIKLASNMENEQLHFYVHDMRKPFRINYFDYIVNLFTSFGYFSNPKDDLATIQAVTQGLKKGGVFVLDFFNAPKIIANLKSEDTIEIDGIKFYIRKKVENNFIIKEISFTDKGKSYTFEERVKALTKTEFENYFRANGLKILHLWGNYQLEEFNLQTSERLIIAATKA